MQLMETVIVKQNQSILDVAGEHLGDADRVVELAILNGVDIDSLASGVLMESPLLDIRKAEITNQFNDAVAPISELGNDAEQDDEWTLYYNEGLPASHL